MQCPDCKGSGKYVGFAAAEPCRRCGGSGRVVSSEAERQAAPIHVSRESGVVTIFAVLSEAIMWAQELMHKGYEDVRVIIRSGHHVLDRDFAGRITVCDGACLASSGTPRVQTLEVHPKARVLAHAAA